MELADPAGAEALAPQPFQLASAGASTKKSLLAHLRILGARAQPMPNGIPAGRKIMQSPQPHALLAPVIGRADGGLRDRTTMLQDEQGPASAYNRTIGHSIDGEYIYVLLKTPNICKGS